MTIDTMRFDVLGTLQVRGSQDLVDVGPRRNREVLATLLIHAGEVVSVETLIDEVWGGADVAPGSVHVVVSRLRSRLGAELVETRAPGYRLALGDHRTDAREFEAHLAAARDAADAATARERIQQALSLWRGDAYADVQVPAVRSEAERLHRLRLGAHQRLAEIDLSTGHHDDVARRLAVLVEAYPLEEGLLVPLMLAQYRCGQQAEALATYERARRVLDEELGLEPTPLVREMQARILQHDPSLSPAPASAAPGPRDRGFIGRTDELKVLDEALRQGWTTPTGPPAVAAVFGEAGIGKTRLAEELAARARSEGVVVAFGRCLESEGTPPLWPWEQALGAVADALDPATRDAALSGRGQLARLLVPNAHDEPVDLAGDVPAIRLHDAVTAFLEVAADARPVLLVLEDMHWSDSGTVELFEYLATTARTGRLALLLTVRRPDLSDTATRQLTAAMSRTGGAVTTVLDGMAVEEVQELATDSLGVEVSFATARTLRERTDGNPFYVSELARLYGDERRRTGRGDTPVPSGVQAVIERRLRHLPAGDLDVLQAAAVIGRTFDLLVLEDVSAVGRLVLLETIDRGVSAGVLVGTDNALEFRFGHALVQEALIASASLARRAAVHAAVAESLEVRHGAHPHAVAAIAHHYVAAYPHGDPVRAVEYSLRAASLAQQRLALEEAERLVRRALPLVQALPPEEAVSLEIALRVRLGTLLTLRHGYNGPGVADERHRVLALSGPDGASADLFSAHWGTWGNALVSGRFASARSAVDVLMETAAATGDPMLTLAGRIARGQSAWHVAELAPARRDLEVAMGLADGADEGFDLDLWLQHPGVQARVWLAMVLAQQGEVEASDAIVQDVEGLVQDMDHLFSTSYAHIVIGLRDIVLDRPEDAARHGRLAMEVASENGFAQLQAFALIPLGWGHGRTTDPESGLAQVSAALEAFGSLPDGHMFGHLMLRLLADLHALAGRPDEALRLSERALDESRRTGERFDLVRLHGLRAELLAPRDPRAAEAELRLATELADEQRQSGSGAK
ncbi:BTAD domain-containing putative transcriptional regulator [Aeromicrobium massiliense]|uniref:BTAD domain-containing putative transcriptional regulator n=1 Tax=Aeromicrobium massiliense TaxID=1464554 RepID=UPI0002D51754|nr:BTAD domain-containing putative transcriptional regulator [Aeromicrobium massiliense]